MFNTQKLSLPPLAAALFLAHTSAFGAPPTPFGQWTNNGGTINANCPSGFSCETSVNDTGIRQQILTDSNGKRYIHQIIVGSDSQGTMTTESFVNGSGGVSGVSVRQELQSSLGGDSMDSLSVINTGWAHTRGAPAVQLQQAISSTSAEGVGYNSTFAYHQNRSGNGNVTGSYLDIRQDVVDSTLLSPDSTATGQDIHSFVTRRASGDEVPNGGSVSLPGSGGMMMDGSGPTGGTMSWSAGDDIQVVWIGQLCEGCQNTGMDGGGGGGMGGMGGGGGGGGMMGTSAGMFSFQAYDNLSDSAAGVATRSLFTTDPINWTAPFGAQPSLGP